MARIKAKQSANKRKSPVKHYTPPPDLAQYNGFAKTPQKSVVIGLRALQRLRPDIKITCAEIEALTSVSESSQTRILQAGQLRTRHNQPDAGPDPRGRKRALTRNDKATISNYLEDESVPLNDRGQPWPTVAEAAGVNLPNTYHFKSQSPEKLHWKSICGALRADENIINAKCEEELELNSPEAKQRFKHAEVKLKERPHACDWLDVAFGDEFHLGIGPQITKRVKRKAGKLSREARRNVHFKAVTSKDTKAKAREREHLPLLNVFVIVGKDYRAFLPYEIPSNKVGKMTMRYYVDKILPHFKTDLQRRNLTLWQDKDSAHKTQGAKDWFKANAIEYITSPGRAPDFSVFESVAQALKYEFHKVPVKTYDEALARFAWVLDNLDQKHVDSCYKSYPKRLRDCKRRDGQMTKY